jgi:non-canonical purine NTP pyrophosphatase (RdgB/HAM1 family)
MGNKSLFENLTFVTGNTNKLREASQILGCSLNQCEVDGLIEMQTSDVSELVVHKLNQAYEAIGNPVLVEDSGLIFTDWNGLPGALVKWFENSVGCAGMIQMLDNFSNREAVAVCYAAVRFGETVRVAKGEARGTIAFEERGTNGFGWDTIFVPEGKEQTFAEMEPKEKNAISHRKKAFEELKRMLNS